MLFQVDFNSDEALYIQLRDQIIVSIATNRISEGESLPSVRQMAEDVGINMHTVNKAYTMLKQEGLIKLDRRRGAVIAVDPDKVQAMREMADGMSAVVARAICKNVSREEAHQILDDVYTEYGGE